MTTPPPGYWTPTTTPRLATAPGRPPVNTWAWVGMFTSISGFLIPIGINGVLGIIFSIFGLREAAKIRAAGFTEDGRPLARAGIIVGIVHIIVTIAVIVLIVLGVGWFVDWMNTVQQELIDSNLSGGS